MTEAGQAPETSEGVIGLKQEPAGTYIEVGSGTYTFTSRLAAATELTELDTGPRKVISFTGVFRTGMQITAKL